MKIAYFTGEYPRATDTFIQREVMGLRASGVEVDTFSVRKPNVKHLVGTEQQAEQERTTYLLPPDLPLLIISHVQLLIANPSGYYSALRLAINTSQPGIRGFFFQIFYFLEAGILAQLCQRRGISHLHNHIAASSCTVAMLASALGQIPFSFTMHGPHIFFEPYRWRLDEKIKQAKFVACISHFCRSQGMIFAPAEHWPKMKIVRCGLDMSLFEPVSHESVGNRLLYVGRLAVEKGLPVVLESLTQLTSQYPDLLLTVVGDGSDRALLEARTRKMGLEKHVDFVGYQSQAAVREFLRKTDIFVLPSFAEGIPVVLMEAMATGVPVVATQIAGISELVKSGENGYLVSPGDSDALSGAISKLVVDADHRNQLGQAGRIQVEQEFNITQSLSRLTEYLAASEQAIAEENSQETSIPVTSASA